jgi:NDP-sugar pyrophosphorylase family protein
MSTIGVIAARRESARLPGKHLLPIGGRPLIEQAIRYMRRIPVLDAVIVSTDDDDIKAIAANYKDVTIHHRSGKWVTDEVIGNEVILHVYDEMAAGDTNLLWIEGNTYCFDHMICQKMLAELAGIEYRFDSKFAQVAAVMPHDHFIPGFARLVDDNNELRSCAEWQTVPSHWAGPYYYLYSIYILTPRFMEIVRGQRDQMKSGLPIKDYRVAGVKLNKGGAFHIHDQFDYEEACWLWERNEITRQTALQDDHSKSGGPS